MDSLKEKSTNLVDRGLSPIQNALSFGLKAAAGTAVAAIGGLTAAIGVSVKSAADMEQQVSDIAAVMGATKEEVGPLKDLIKSLGIDPGLKVSATEAADAIGMLARNGLSMQEILDGAARSTVLMSNATGADFGTAANIATDAMALFGITAKDMDTAVDGISSVLTSSKLDINDYGLALANAGGMAKTVGLGFSDFNAVLSASASYFSGGADAGTSFRNFIKMLQPTTKPAIEAMRELGLLTAQGTSAFYDASGNLKDMATVAGMLNRATANLTAEQRIQAFTTIFGADAMRTAAAMADMTEESFRELQKSMAQKDAAEMAKTRVDTLAGAIEILSSVISGIGLEIGDAFLPVFRMFVEAITDFVSQHSGKIIEWAQTFAGWIGKLFEVYLPPLIEKITGAFNAILEFGKAIFSFLQGDGDALRKWVDGLPDPWRTVAGAVLGVMEALGAFAGYMWNNIIVPAYDWIKQFVTLTDVLTGLGLVIAFAATRSVVAALGAFVIAWGPVGLLLAGAIGAVALIRTAWENDWWNIREHFRSVAEYLDSRFGLLLSTIRTFGWGALQEIWDFVRGNDTQFTHLRAIWDVTKLTAQVLFNDLVNFVRTHWPAWRDKLAEWGTAAWEWIKVAVPEALRQLGIWGSSLWKWLVDNSPTWWEKLKIWGTAIWNWIKVSIPLALGALGEWLTGMGKWLVEKGPEWNNALGKFMVGAFEYIGKIIPQALHKVSDVMVNILKFISVDLAGGMSQAISYLAGVAGKEENNVVGAFLGAVGNILLAVIEVGVKMGLALLTAFAQTILSFLGINVSLWKFFDYIQEVTGRFNIKYVAQQLWERFAQGTRESILGPVVTAFNNAWAAFRNAFFIAAGALYEHVWAPIVAIMTRVSNAIGSINIGGMMATTLGQAIHKFNEWKDSFWNHVWNPIASVMNRIAAALQSVNLGGIMATTLGQAIHKFNEWKDSFYSYVWNPVAGIASRIAAALQTVDMGKVMTAVIDNIRTSFNTWSTAFWNNVWAPAKGIVERIGSALQSVNLHGTMWETLNGIVAGFNEWVQWAWDALWNPIKNIGHRIGDGLLDGLRDKWNSITQWFRDLTSSIPQWVRDALGIRSPSRVFMEIGGSIMEGLLLGAEQFTDMAQDAMYSAASSMTSAALQGAGETINNVRTNNINVTIPNAASITDPEGSARRYTGVLSDIYG